MAPGGRPARSGPRRDRDTPPVAETSTKNAPLKDSVSHPTKRPLNTNVTRLFQLRTAITISRQIPEHVPTNKNRSIKNLEIATVAFCNVDIGFITGGRRGKTKHSKQEIYSKKRNGFHERLILLSQN